LDIFDRWGAKVFTTSDQAIGWDGSNNDKPVLAGVYTYYLKYEKSHPKCLYEEFESYRGIGPVKWIASQFRT
jgi:gliding motility-associated-like protein